MIQTPKLSPTCSRFVNALPNMSWANAKDLWNNLTAKEQYLTRNPLMISRHPGLQARMRSILLNWLSEVSEVYQLHRETYYLAIDFFDRYLSTQKDISKAQLQLVGITCLFIAAKVQEIYPPKVSEFAYVTDGACTEKQIILKELVILKSLNWNLNTMTVNSWLTIHMQLHSRFEREKLNSAKQVEQRQQRLSPNKYQPPKKRKRTALSNSPGLQVADTNKQVIVANWLNKQIDVKVDSDDEKQQSKNLNNITNKKQPQQQQQHQSIEEQQTNSDSTKDELKTPTNNTPSSKSFISSNLKLSKDQDDDEFMYQKYDSFLFAQIAYLVDLSMLDIGSLKFSYSVISASALYHFINGQIVTQCTGFRIDQIQECILWMTPFALAIRDEGFELLRLKKHELIEKMPNIQAHTVDLKLLDKAQMKQQQVLAEHTNNSVEKSVSNSNENDVSSTKSTSLISPLKNSSTIPRKMIRKFRRIV